MPSGAPSSQSLKDEKRRRRQECAGRLLAEAELAGRTPMANWSRRSTAMGRGSRKKIGDKIKRQGAGEGRRARPQPTCMQATRDSVHALMMIRAYRMRGHLHANLDPLGLRSRRRTRTNSIRAAYGFTEADLDRRIFLDKVLGLEFATMREIVAILRRTYCQTLGVEFMHISEPAQKGLDPGAHRRPRQGDHLHAARASARSSTSWSRPKASRSSSTSNTPAPSASASTAARR